MRNIYFALAGMMTAATMMAQSHDLPRLLSPTEAQEVTDDIIFEAPEGETKNYVEGYDGWVFWGSELGMFYNSDNRTDNEIVWGEDGNVYILNPVVSFPTDSYAVGKYADGKITVQLPQCIGSYYDSFGEIAYMYLNKMEEVEQDGEKYYMICYPEDNFLVYDVDSQGNITLNLGNDKTTVDTDNGVNPQYLAAMTYENTPHAMQVWSGFGDSFEDWSLIADEDPITPPDGIASEFWGFETLGHKSLLEVKIDGDDIYLNGFTSYITEFWIKGKLDEEKNIVIPTQQYMGNTEYGQRYYFLATKVIPPVDATSWNTYEMIDQITMTYDPDTKIYSAPGEAFCVSTYRDYVAYVALAESPMLWKQDKELIDADPLNPYVSGYQEFNPDTYQGTITWEIPYVNVNGQLLPTDRMYYNFYADGELFTFEPEDYPLFTEPTTNVPYDASNYFNIFVYQEAHTITFTFSDAESYGLQSFYKADDGTIYASELVTVSAGSVGVESMENAKDVNDVTFFTISGSKVENPGNGLFIKHTTYTDGSQKTEKTFIR